MKRVLKIIMILLLIGIAVFGASLALLCWREAHIAPASGEEEAIIVLGAQVRPDGTPSVQLQWRLDTALAAWKSRNVPVVVCGAQGSDEPAPEGEIMKVYLVSEGIPEEQVYTDCASFNTWTNLRNARALLPGVRRVVVVTSDYHVPRALDMARQLGFEAEGIGSPCLSEYWVKNHFRETLAWWKYWGQKYLHLFGGLPQ